MVENGRHREGSKNIQYIYGEPSFLNENNMRTNALRKDDSFSFCFLCNPSESTHQRKNQWKWKICTAMRSNQCIFHSWPEQIENKKNAKSKN